jgi:hypothetical protein
MVAGAEVDEMVINVDDAEPLSIKAGAAPLSNVFAGEMVSGA